MNERTQFRIGLSMRASSKYYWSKDVGNPCIWNDGYLTLNGFCTEGFDECHYFVGKVHALANWIVSFINTYCLDNLPIVAKKDIEASPLWKSFKRIVAKVMKKRKLGKGIRIGSPDNSYVGGYWPDRVSRKTELGKMINSGELLEVNVEDALAVSWTDDIFDGSEIEKDKPLKLNEKFIEEILSKQKYTIMTVEQRW